jgi:hypothetical protein
VSNVLNCKNGGKLLLVAVFDENCVKRLLVYNETFIFCFRGRSLGETDKLRLTTSCEFEVSSNSTNTTAAKLVFLP